MSHALLALLFFFTSASGTGAAGRSSTGTDGLTDAQAQAIVTWVTAVERHTPGQRDAGTGRIATMTFAQRVELHEGMAFFLAVIQGKRSVTRSEGERRVVELGIRIRTHPGTDAFLKRAAVLHSDVALQNRVDDAKPVDLAADVPSNQPAPPLLSRQRHVLDKDGEILGDAISDWNWPFARSLLDLLYPRPGDDPFVRTWYHATTAFMLKRGIYAEAVTHLGRAGDVLPDDPLVLFDRASYAEVQGLPVLQVLLSDDDVFVQRSRNNGRTPPRTTSQGASTLGIPLAEITNTEAERLYRRALRADPTFVEARVRLGRLLHERKRYAEAAAELATALAAKPDGPVAFFAHLFAGRSARALGKIAEAAGHFKAATLLFPGAQSAQLALSQAALLESDVPAALESLQRLDTSKPASDPWWSYHLASGRDADTLLRAMWAQVPKL